MKKPLATMRLLLTIAFGTSLSIVNNFTGWPTGVMVLLLNNPLRALK